MSNPLVALKNRLTANREKSAAARCAVVRRLAAMSPEELRQVQRKVWARLGAEDFAELVRQSQALARLGLAPQKIEAPAAAKPESTTLGARMLRKIRHWSAVEPLWWVVVASTTKSAFMAVMLVLAAPGAMTVFEDIGVAPRPFFCPRLDRWAHDCHYVVGSEVMTLERAAKLLHQPYDEVARANFPIAPSQIVPRGARLWAPPRRVFDLFR